jgi:glycosyltransferase involved in cell wall biosynthesis
MNTARDGIALVSFTGDSGIADYSVSLARALARLGPTTLISSQRLPARFAGMGFEVVRLFRRTRWYPLDMLRFVAWCLRRRPQVLGLQSVLKWPLLDGCVIAILRAAGLRCVLTVHDVLPHEPRPWSRALQRWFLRRFDALVVHSEAARQQVAALAPGLPMIRLHHGVYDLYRLDVPDAAEARRRIGLPADMTARRCVLFFGHLEARKGLGVLLDAIERLRGRDDFVFMIAGPPPCADGAAGLRRRLREAAAWPGVVLHAQRVPFEQVQDYLAAADVVLLPYLEGSTSGVLKLALAFGVPVIATRVGDLPEELRDGGGLLLDAGEGLAERLAAALLQVTPRLAELREGMRRGACAGDWDGIAAAYRGFVLDGELAPCPGC